MQYIYRVFAFVLLVLLVSTDMQAQNLQGKELLQETIKEKLRTRYADFLQYHLQQQQNDLNRQEDPNWNAGQMTTDATESQINNTPEAESELHAAINPTDTMNIIVSAMRNDPQNFNAPLSFPIYYTTDFGATWQLSSFDGTNNLTGLIAGGGDPMFAFTSDGTVYLSWLTVSIDIATFSGKVMLHLAESTDKGATWTELAVIDEADIADILTLNIDRFVDKEWMASDLSGGQYQDNVYIAYTELRVNATGDTAFYDIFVKTKEADSTDFGGAYVVVNQLQSYQLVQFTSIDVDNNGRVHVSFVGSPNGFNLALYHAYSDDGGATFSPEVKISDLHIPVLSPDEPINPVVGIDSARLYPCPHIKVDKSGGAHDGNIYAVWTANGRNLKETNGLDIYFSKSTDGGLSWSPSRILNDDSDANLHQFFSSIEVTKGGVLAVTWYDRREDANNLETKYYMTYSYDGGDSFISDFPVSSQAANFAQIGGLNGNFGVGEYTQVISTENLAIPIWADGRTNDGNIDLYAAFVSLDSTQTVSIEEYGTLSTNFSLKGLFPNVVKDETKLVFSLEKPSEVVVKILNVSGQIMMEETSKMYSQGEHEKQLDMSELAAGQYILAVETDFGFKVKKFVVVK